MYIVIVEFGFGFIRAARASDCHLNSLSVRDEICIPVGTEIDKIRKPVILCVHLI